MENFDIKRKIVDDIMKAFDGWKHIEKYYESIEITKLSGLSNRCYRVRVNALIKINDNQIECIEIIP